IPLMREIPGFDNFYWMQDGAPPHYSTSVRNFLTETFNEKWIGRQGPIAWPPRSPDLTVCDFWLWGYLKGKIFDENRPKTLAELRARIEEECGNVTQEMCEKACRSAQN